MRRFTFHVVGLPHLSVSKTNSFCAYTQKTLNFCRMMYGLGHTVHLYGAPYAVGDEIPQDLCTTFSLLLTPEQHQGAGFGQYETHRAEMVYKLDNYEADSPLWKLVNQRVTELVGDATEGFICVLAGAANAPLQETTKLPVVEYGIGYGATFAQFRVFESYSHMHMLYGAEQGSDPQGRWYDAVIPNYFDPADFGYSHDNDGYLLYLGRMIRRKGLNAIKQISEATGLPVKFAGFGADLTADGFRTHDGIEFNSKWFEYVGVVGVQQRRELLQHALALVAPTTYAEPFGGVAVEAQLCGTPVLSTDWGAFTETVTHGVSGYRCRTLGQFCRAAARLQNLDRDAIYRNAVSRWGLQRVCWQYQEYFEMLDDLQRNGWEQIPKNMTPLDWLVK